MTDDDGEFWSSIVAIPTARILWPQVSISGANAVLYQGYERTGTLPSGEPRLGLCKIEGIRTDGTFSSPGVKDADVSGLNSIGQFALGQGTFVLPMVWAVDPNDPSHLLAADAGENQMKVSRDGGATWTADTQLTDLVTGYSPVSFLREFRFAIPKNEYFRGIIVEGANLQAHVIAFDPYHKGHILVATEAAGLFRSTDGGASWSSIPDSRKVTAASSIFFIDENASGNTIPEAVVATYGRGLWKVTLPPPAASGHFFRLPPNVMDRWRNDCWLRKEGCIDPASLLDPASCDGCRYEAVVGGEITDILFAPNGGVRAFAINGGRVVASSQDGQPVTPILPTSDPASNQPFSGCPECLNLVGQGGSVKGVVIQGGLLRAIIGGFGPLPGEDWLNQFSPPPPQTPPTPDLVPPTGPYLELIGSVAVGGQPTALLGDAFTVAGSGFCGGPNCPPVVLMIGDRVAAANVPVDANGNFQAGFFVSEPPGIYSVTAMQQVLNGQLLTAAGQLVVPVGEAEEEDEPPELDIHNENNSFTISWPSSAEDFVLEWTMNLADPNSWQEYPGQIVLIGDEKTVFLQPGGMQAFFRLRK